MIVAAMGTIGGCGPKAVDSTEAARPKAPVAAKPNGSETVAAQLNMRAKEAPTPCPPSPIEVRTEAWGQLQNKLDALERGAPEIRTKLQEWLVKRNGAMGEAKGSWWYEPYTRDVRSTLVLVERQESPAACRERVVGLDYLRGEWLEGRSGVEVRCVNKDAENAYDVVYRLLLALQNKQRLELMELVPQGVLQVRHGVHGALDLETCEPRGTKLKALSVNVKNEVDWSVLPALGRAEFIGMKCTENGKTSACTTRIAMQDTCVHVCTENAKPSLCGITWVDWGH
jgi:hypothetical protein